MEIAVTIDLDDTLIETQDDYTEAREWFAEYVSQRYATVTKADATEIQTDCSRDLLSEYGLSVERYPNACLVALETLVDNPSEEERQRVFEIGASAMKEEFQYANRGFRENAEELISVSNAVSDFSVLLTAGDNSVQNRKVNALDLADKFDSVEITEMDGKSDFLRSLSNSFDKVVHIGNSFSSDVQAALDANVSCIYVPQKEWREGEQDAKYDDVQYAENITEAISLVEELGT